MPPKNPYKEVFDDLEDGVMDGMVNGVPIPGYWDDVVPDEDDEQSEEEVGIHFVTRKG